MQSYDSLPQWTIYMEEVFSASRFAGLVGVLLVLSVVGGSVYISQMGYDPSTQNWLSLCGIVFTVLLFGLTPLFMRPL
jgi:hypothetical protein